jgi:Uma2 family endonuclease
MTTSIRPMTADELSRMPEDGFRHELVRGELKRMAPAGNEHGKLAMEIGGALFQHVKTHGLGTVYAAETGFKLSSNPDTVRAPDVAFVSVRHISEAGEPHGYWPGAPDLAVEVVSPEDVYTEVEEKVLEWLEAGTRMVVVVNPRKRAVTVYRSLSDIVVLTNHDILDGGDVVPGWKLPLSDLFA